MQYLRLRYYDLATGRFNRLDPLVEVIVGPVSLHKYLYANGDPITLIDPWGLTGVPGQVYQDVGIAVDWMFKIYLLALGYPNPGAELGTLIPSLAGSQYANLKPDLTDVSGKAYYELKPVTWATDRVIPQTGQRTLTDLLRTQMTNYKNALEGLGYDRGDSPSLTFTQPKLPIGLVQHGAKWYVVSLRPAEDPLCNGDDGRGVLWYELDETRKEDWENQKRMPVPQQVPQQWRDIIDPFYFERQDSPVNLYWVTTAAVTSTLGWAILLAISGSQMSAAYAATSITISMATVSITGRIAA
jgi:hypothetical protein